MKKSLASCLLFYENTKDPQLNQLSDVIALVKR